MTALVDDPLQSLELVYRIIMIYENNIATVNHQHMARLQQRLSREDDLAQHAHTLWASP